MGKLRDLRIPIVFLAAVCLFVFSAASGWADSQCGGTHPANISIQHNFATGSLNAWEMPFPEDWEILQQGNLHYLHMKRNREPGVPRRPLQFARLKGVEVGSFTLNVNVRRAGGSMIVVFNYVDTLHFYYVHLSENPGTQISVHNGIFIVNGGPRYRIAGLQATPALPDRFWHHVRVVRNVGTGSIQVFLDKQSQPKFSVIDRTFTCGQVGLGSFDETGDFAQFRLQSRDAQLSAAAK
ncbi:MAG: hypothetical protein ACYCSP_04120 [Acidobacteriaceae bacterium]